jgi:tRNA(His) 5'-end guanylyltransferase
MATMAFNKFFRRYTSDYFDAMMALQDFDLEDKYLDALYRKLDCAMFDSRCFNIPVEEVTNCLIWRQQDATRNAIQMLGQCNFSHKELHGKSCNDIQDMLMLQKGINFNDMPTEFKRGVCCRKNEDGKWTIDKEMPIFTQDRDYIENAFCLIKEN